jgi:hypothetical protein
MDLADRVKALEERVAALEEYVKQRLGLSEAPPPEPGSPPSDEPVS